MAELFQKDQSVIARHVKNVFNEGELDEKSNMQILHNTKYKYRPTKVYNLDVIISVGYRVKSKRGTHVTGDCPLSYQMAELFATLKQLISHHIANILKDIELDGFSVVKQYLTTAADGKNDVTGECPLSYTSIYKNV